MPAVTATILLFAVGALQWWKEDSAICPAASLCPCWGSDGAQVLPGSGHPH